LCEFTRARIVVVVRGDVHLRMQQTTEYTQYERCKCATMSSACFHLNVSISTPKLSPPFLFVSRYRPASWNIRAIRHNCSGNFIKLLDSASRRKTVEWGLQETSPVIAGHSIGRKSRDFSFPAVL
jgi:hypothetical protein